MEGNIRKHKVTVLRSRNNSHRTSSVSGGREGSKKDREVLRSQTPTLFTGVRFPDAAEIYVTQGDRKAKQPEPGV